LAIILRESVSPVCEYHRRSHTAPELRSDIARWRTSAQTSSQQPWRRRRGLPTGESCPEQL
jgi:hypothetical protein